MASEVGDGHGRGVEAHAAHQGESAALAGLRRLDGGEAVANVLGVGGGMFAHHRQQLAVAQLPHQHLHLGLDLGFAQHPAGFLGAAGLEAAVGAAVDAGVAQVKRGVGGDAGAVDLALHGPGRLGHALALLGRGHGHQFGGFVQAQVLDG